MTNKCGQCHCTGYAEMLMVVGCNHSFCLDCAKLIKIGGKCTAEVEIGGGGKKPKCNQEIKEIKRKIIDSDLSDLKSAIKDELEFIEFEKQLLRNVKDGITSFTKNLISSSSQLIERNVRCLESDQQEKIEMLRRGKNLVSEKLRKITEIVKRAEDIKRGDPPKMNELMERKKECDYYGSIIGEFRVNEHNYRYASNMSDEPGTIKVHPMECGVWTGAIDTPKKEVDAVAQEGSIFFPPTYLPTNYLTTHLVPPFMDFFFVIPKFFDSAPHPKPVSSPIFQTLPFLFQWKFTVFPGGNSKVKKEQEFVSVLIELVSGNEPEVALEYKKLFPEYGSSTTTFPNYNPSSSATGDSIAAVMRNPFVFDYKIQLIAPSPSADASKRIYSYESTANFERNDPDRQGKADFITKAQVEADGFLWNTVPKHPQSLHFIFGIRFPSFKREYEALRVAHSRQAQGAPKKVTLKGVPKGKKK